MRFSVVFLLLVVAVLMAACGPVTTVPQPETPVVESTPVFVPSPPAPLLASWPGMESGWTVFRPNPRLRSPIYDPQGYFWALREDGGAVFRWDIQTGDLATFSQAENLPHLMLDAALHQGQLWVCAEDGSVSVYQDGAWVTTQVSEESLHALLSTSNRLWARGVDDQYYYFEGQTWQRFDDFPESWGAVYIDEIVQAQDGTYWFKNWSFVARWDGENWLRYDNLRSVRKMLAGSNGVIYFLLDDVVAIFDGLTIKPVTLPGDLFQYEIEFSSLTPDGKLWLEVYGAETAYLFDGPQVVPAPLEDFSAFNSYEQYGYRESITPVGWLFTHPDFFYIYDGNRGKKFSVPSSAILGDFIRRNVIGFGPDGSLWVGDESVARFDGTETTTYLKEDYEFHYNDNILIDRAGDLWTFYEGNSTLLKYDVSEDKITPYNLNLRINHFAFAPEGTLWLAVQDGYIAKLNLGEVSPDDLILLEPIRVGAGIVEERLRPDRIEVGPDGRVWVFVLDKGLYGFDGTTWKYYGLYAARGDSSSFAINSLGQVWAGFNYHLYKHDGQGWINYQRNCIFPSGLAVAPDDAVWFINGCDGVMRFDGNEWTHYTREKEMQGIIPDKILFAPDGAVWFIARDGWVRYQPER